MMDTIANDKGRSGSTDHGCGKRRLVIAEAAAHKPAAHKVPVRAAVSTRAKVANAQGRPGMQSLLSEFSRCVL
jgi:hypothetical protein